MSVEAGLRESDVGTEPTRRGDRRVVPGVVVPLDIVRALPGVAAARAPGDVALDGVAGAPELVIGDADVGPVQCLHWLLYPVLGKPSLLLQLSGDIQGPLDRLLVLD